MDLGELRTLATKSEQGWLGVDSGLIGVLVQLVTTWGKKGGGACVFVCVFVCVLPRKVSQSACARVTHLMPSQR